MKVLSPVASVGRSTFGLIAAIGRVTIFAATTLLNLFRPPFYWREFLSALMTIGYFSLPVVGLTTLFTGGALALQIFAGSARFSAEAVVPQIVAIGMVRETWPGPCGPDDRGARDVQHRRRNCDDEGHRADRRVGHTLDRPDALPDLATGGWPATLVVPLLVAVGDNHRHFRRLSGRHRAAGLQRRRLSDQHRRFS